MGTVSDWLLVSLSNFPSLVEEDTWDGLGFTDCGKEGRNSIKGCMILGTLPLTLFGIGPASMGFLSALTVMLNLKGGKLSLSTCLSKVLPYCSHSYRFRRSSYHH